MNRSTKQSLKTRLKPSTKDEYAVSPATGKLIKPLENRLFRLYRFGIEDYLLVLASADELENCHRLFEEASIDTQHYNSPVLIVVSDIFAQRQTLEEQSVQELIDIVFSESAALEPEQRKDSAFLDKSAQFLRLLLLKPLAEVVRHKDHMMNTTPDG